MIFIWIRRMILKNFRLNEDELLDESHLPVLIVMNMISENRFLKILESVSKGIGFGEEYGACTMPYDLDEFDKSNGGELDGVEFGLHNGDEIVVDFQSFYYYLKIMCEKYIKINSEHSNVIIKYLEEYSHNFLKI